jgi:hypothetical protein
MCHLRGGERDEEENCGDARHIGNVQHRGAERCRGGNERGS